MKHLVTTLAVLFCFNFGLLQAMSRAVTSAEAGHSLVDSSAHTATVATSVHESLPGGGPCSFLAYEPFNYPSEQALHLLQGGSGWQAPWQVQNADATLPGYQVVSSPSIPYGSLVSSGGHATGGQAYLTAGRRLNTSPQGPFADYVTQGQPFIGGQAEGSELWVSLLLQKHADNDEPLAVDLHDNEIVTCPQCPNTQHIGVGYFGASSNVDGQRRWSLSVNEEILPTGVPLEVGVPAFIVLRLRFEAGQTLVEVYVNPAQLGEAGPPAPSLSHTAPGAQRLRSLAFYAGPQPANGAIDEIRFASTYACAAPGPGTVVNQPPVALATASPTSGEAPLIVNFDGSGAYDPEGEALEYRWDFGDGSPEAQGVAASHTYTMGGGIYEATLTVMDPLGAESSTTLSIAVQTAGQSIPCLSTVTAEAMADCTGQGGSITVHLEPNTQGVLRREGQLLNPISGNRYENLSAGGYTLDVTGSNGCAEQRELHIRVDSTTCPGWAPDACAMPIGTNLNGFADWVPQRPLKNFLKNTRGEPIPYTDACNCWALDEPSTIIAQMQMDENGYPLSIPQTTNGGATKLRFFVSADGENMPPALTYVLLYDGIGDIVLRGPVSNELHQPGRLQFDLGGDGTFWFHIEASQLGNHIRNIRILRIEHEFADLEADPFYEPFLERIAPFQNLRFMDWMHTNNNPLRHWNERKRPGYYTYGGDAGVPYEVIIQLANQLGKDIWICVPHAANDDFIAQMAALFRDGLDPHINIYLEYSNEVWNWIFDQAHYNLDNNPLDLMYGRAMAERARKVFRIWHEAFGEDTCRVKRVLGLQAGFNYLNEHILAHLPQDEWDYGSPTHYFGLDHEETGRPRLDLLGGDATVQDVMANARHHFAEFAPLVRQDYRNVQLYGKEVITYEGGQHFVGNVFGIPYDYQQAMWDAQNTPLMYDMYNEVLDSIRRWGCRLASNFSLVGPQESIYGSWGVLDHIDLPGPYAITAPKYQVHLDNMPPAGCPALSMSPDCDESPTSVAEPSLPKEPGFRAYPNPGSSHITLDYPGPAAPTSLYSLTGQLLLRTTERQLEVGSLPPGLYLLRHGQAVVKWVKQ